MKQTIVATGVILILLSGSVAQGHGFFEPKRLNKKQQAKVDSAPVGSSENPIRCEAPAGEREYLGRLRCPSGLNVTFSRAGSVGEGPYGTILDLYDVQCAEWKEPVPVYMDMYHDHFIESKPVPRLSLAPPK